MRAKINSTDYGKAKKTERLNEMLELRAKLISHEISKKKYWEGINRIGSRRSQNLALRRRIKERLSIYE